MGADHPATAEGELGRTPLAHLLVYALDRRLNGALFFRELSGIEHVVQLARGAPVKLRPGHREDLLGEMLVEAGAVGAATIEDAVAMTGLLGDVLMLTGSVDRDVLERVAEEQFVRRVVRLFSLPKETRYRYCEGLDALVDYGGELACVDPLKLLWAGMRVHGDASTMMVGSLSLLGDGALRLHPAATTGRLGLDSGERRVIEELDRGPASMSQLAALRYVPEATLRRLCYTLLITRQIELGSGTLPVGANELQRTPPSGNAVVAKMQLKASVHRYGAAAPDPPGDGERTTAIGRRLAEARAAVLQEVARPPPKQSSVPPPEDPLATLKSASSRPPPPMTLAEEAAGSARRSGSAYPDVQFEVLSEAEEEALHSIESQSEIRPTVSVRGRSKMTPLPGQVTVLSAPVLFELANARLSERDLEGALDACMMARRAAPGEPDYVALFVWIRLQMPSADIKALTIELDQVLAANEAHIQGRYYRALLRRRLSDDPGAIRDLQRVIELFPAHSDAARELASLEARRPKERAGFFGRLFKR